MTDSYTIITHPGPKLPENYTGLVYSRWLRSLRKYNELFNAIDHQKFFEEYHKYIENLLSKPGSEVRLAALSDDHDVILGFSVVREDVLDYVHVHLDQRGQKISTALIPQGITTFSHITKLWIPIWQAKYKHFKFNPFA